MRQRNRSTNSKSNNLPGSKSDKASSSLPSVNDNALTPDTVISFSALAEGMHIDEDTLLQRFAEVLSKRDNALNSEDVE
jgi:hypothetical protein